MDSQHLQVSGGQQL